MNLHTLNFRVFLSRRLRIPVQVDYATSDGTAHAGSDYRAASGTLTFRAGETAKTISVPVLQDSHNEGYESMTLTLSNPHPWRRVHLHDATATGTIGNADPMPGAWIGRFGRTVADQVLDAVDDRMQVKPAPGVEAHVAGQRIGSGPAFAADPQGDPMSGEADAFGLGQPMSGRELLPGTSFSLTAETGGEGLVSVWGGGAVTRFAGRDAAGAEAGGDVAVDGEVASAMLGADWTRGRWTTGLAITRSRSDGGYRGAGDGTVSATLTGVWPGRAMRWASGFRCGAWLGLRRGQPDIGAARGGRHPRRSDPNRSGSLDGGGRTAWCGARRRRRRSLSGGEDRCHVCAHRVGRGIRGRRQHGGRRGRGLTAKARAGGLAAVPARRRLGADAECRGRATPRRRRRRDRLRRGHRRRDRLGRRAERPWRGAARARPARP